MPIENSGEIRLRGTASDGRTDINEEINSNATDTDVSLGTLNTTAFTAVSDGSVVTGRAMSEMRGYSAFTSALPQTEATGALGESLLFSASDNVYLQDANMSLDTNNKTFTTSLWVKRNKTGATKHIFNQSFSTTDILGFKFNSDDTLLFSKYKNGASDNFNVYSEHKLIDTSSWYHIVLAVDTTKTYANDRVRIYVNGIELKTTSGSTFPAQNQNLYVNNGAYPYQIGRINYSLNEQIGGTIADYKHIDGKQLRPDSFGELVQGIWIPKAFNAASTDTLVTDNLNVNLQFVGNANDEKDNYDGTPTSVNFLSNNYGIADFNGSSSKLELGAGALASGTGAKSITMWIATTTTAYSSLVKTGNGSANQYWLFRVNSGTSLGISGFLGSGDFDVNVSHTGLFNGSWHQVAVTYDGTTQELFVDGQSVGTKTMSSLNIPSQKVFIGYQANSNGSGASSYFDGQIGEVQFYNDQLTKEEVLQNYNATKHKYTYGLNGFWLPLNNTSIGSIDSSSNLKLHLDASDSSSYSGSGTNWNDLTSNNNDGTISGANYLSSTNGGVFDFDGSNDFVSIASSGLLTGDFTIEMWWKFDTLNNYRMLWGGSDYAGTNTTGGLGHYIQNQTVRTWLTNSSGSAVNVATSGNVLSTNKWHHIVLTRSGSNVKSYVDGKETSSGTYSGDLSSANTYIGAHYNDPDYYVDGKNAQTRVYNKALTAQEVITNYRATQGNYEQVSTVDISGNANSFTSTNINATDHIKDEPLDDYATLNSADLTTGGTISEGNLKFASGANGWNKVRTTLAATSGKWYFEMLHISATNNSQGIGIVDANAPNKGNELWGQAAGGIIYYGQNGVLYENNLGGQSYSSSYGSNTRLMCAFDMDAGKIWFGRNGTWIGDPVAGTGAASTTIKNYITAATPFAASYYSGASMSFDFGQHGFTYDPPTGFKALSTSNLSAPAFDPDGVTQDKPSNYFKAVTYQGNGGTQGEAYGYKEGSRAAVFNGSSSKIALPSLGSGFTGSSSRSVSAWVKITSTPSGSIAIFNSGSDATLQSFGYFIGTSRQVIISYYNRNWETSETISLDTWNHILFTYNGGVVETSSNSKIYINGTLATLGSTTGSATGSINTTDTNHSIGVYSPTNSLYFNGSIDQVRIFDKVLSSTEAGYLADDDTTNINAISNLVAHYDMEGDANDNASQTITSTATYQLDGNDDDTTTNYDGTSDSNVTYSATGAKFGQAANFNGSSSRIVTTLNANGFSQIAISCWINTSLSSGTGNGHIVSANDGANWCFLSIVKSTGIVTFGASNGGSSIFSATHTGAINDGNWHHVVGNYNGTNATLYIDSIGHTPVSATASLSVNTAFGIGYRNTAAASTTYYNGKIDQVRIFNVALGQEAITALYNETTTTAQSASIQGALYDGTDTNITYTQDKPYDNIDVGFAPDLVWVKNRTSTSGYYHGIFDSVRGANKVISSNNTDSENQYGNWTQQLTSFDSDGFSLGDNSDSGNYVNLSGDDYVAWSWKAAGAANTYNVLEGGTVTSDSTASGAGITTGTTNLLALSANKDNGFSIFKYSGNGYPANSSATQSIAHGLSKAPEIIIIKKLDSNSPGNGSWVVGTKYAGNGWDGGFYLNSTGNYSNTINYFWSANPTSSVINIKSDWFVNGSNSDYIAYAFHSVDGFSKIGSYNGNSSADGPFIYTGFKPAWIMIKKSSGTAFSNSDRWLIYDNARTKTNTTGDNNSDVLYADSSSAENGIKRYTTQVFSNGFKLAQYSEGHNHNSSDKFIYMAFAEDPVKYSNGVATFGDGNEFIQDANYPEDNFATTIYSGSIGNDKFVETGVNADLIWWKNRDTTDNHQLYDTVRGNFAIYSNLTDVQYDYSGHPNGDLAPKILENGFKTPPVENNGINDSGRDMVAWSWKGAGHEYKSARFNSSSQIVVSTISSIKSYSFWIKGGVIGNNYGRRLFGLDSSGYTSCVTYIGNATSRVGVVDGSGNIYYSDLISDRNWHHVVVTTNGTDTLKIYTDGNLSSTNSTSYFTSSFTHIGSDNSNRQFSGSLDQIRIFNKELSSTEVTTLYNETKATVDTLQVLGDASCIATYRLNGDASDLSGNYNGTESNIIYHKGGHFAYNIYENKTRTFSHKASDLSLNTSTIVPDSVNANRDNGFSIAKYTGVVNGLSKTFAHGLSKPPEMVIIKDVSWGTPDWFIWHKDLSSDTHYLRFTAAQEAQTSTVFSAAPTKDVVHIGNDSGVGNRTDDYIAYCWHSVPGFSKIGKYQGNAGTQTIDMGFEPAAVFFKVINQSQDWILVDNKRGTGSSGAAKFVSPSTNAIESYFSTTINFVENGLYLSGTSMNWSGYTFAYMAFAHR